MAGSSESSSQLYRPFGNLPNALAGRVNKNYATPLSMAFGMGGGTRYDNFMDRMNSGQYQGPLAGYIQQTMPLLAQQIPQAQQLSRQITDQGNQAFAGYEGQINNFLAQLPNLQSLLGQVGAGFGGLAQQGAGATAAGLGQANAMATPGSNAVGYAQQAAEQAFSPIASNALYQNAMRQGLDQTRQGAAARGTLDSGGAQATEETMARDLAAQFAQQQFANQQAAASGLGTLAAQQAGLGLQQAQLGAGMQEAGLGGQGNAALQQAQLGGMGADAASQLFQAIPQLAQLLQGAQQMPFQAAQDVANFFAAQQNPSMALLQATAPVLGQTSKGWNVL